MMMKKPTVTYNQFDVLLVPFPFTDSAHSKQRPALVLSTANSFNAKADASVMAMVTTATHHPWPLDMAIEDLSSAGLPVPSVIRMKLFTLDHRLILRKLGKLGKKDQMSVFKTLTEMFLIA
jgi:mRNA interferase MazF